MRHTAALLLVARAIGADAGTIAENQLFIDCIAAPSTCLSLDLKNLGLSGEIPETIGTATKLTDLRLNNNQLSGQIPSDIGLLSELTAFTLAHNSLKGGLPEELANLNKLVHFSAAYNQLTGPISAAQWGAWASLETLELEDNSLSGNLPAAIGQAASLQKLSLAHNFFDGALPAELGSLANLKELYLYMNLFTGLIPDALDGLNLTTCELTSPAELVGDDVARKPFNVFTQPVPVNVSQMCTVVASPPFHLPSGGVPATCWMCLHHRCTTFGDNKCAHTKRIADPHGAGRQRCMCACCASQCNALKEPGVCWPDANGIVAAHSPAKSGGGAGGSSADTFAIHVHAVPNVVREAAAEHSTGPGAPVLALAVVALAVGVIVRRKYVAARAARAAATPIN